MMVVRMLIDLEMQIVCFVWFQLFFIVVVMDLLLCSLFCICLKYMMNELVVNLIEMIRLVMFVSDRWNLMCQVRMQMMMQVRIVIIVMEVMIIELSVWQMIREQIVMSVRLMSFVIRLICSCCVFRVVEIVLEFCIVKLSGRVLNLSWLVSVVVVFCVKLFEMLGWLLRICLFMWGVLIMLLLSMNVNWLWGESLLMWFWFRCVFILLKVLVFLLFMVSCMIQVFDFGL